MAIIVEDGTGLATAQSYASVAECDAYHLARGSSAWAAAAAAAKEAALVRASAALDGLYGSRWPGARLTADQALDWPRSDAWDSDGWPLTLVPAAIKNATCEAALVELGEAGALSSALAHGGAVKREKVGTIEVEYANGAAVVTVHRAIAQALARIVRGCGMLRITRG